MLRVCYTIKDKEKDKAINKDRLVKFPKVSHTISKKLFYLYLINKKSNDEAKESFSEKGGGNPRMSRP